jgi:hypothetical protein
MLWASRRCLDVLKFSLLIVLSRNIRHSLEHDELVGAMIAGNVNKAASELVSI